MLFSFFSETTLLNVSLPIAILVLLLIILIGILFDIVGIAVTYQDITAYTAMASKKIRGAREAMRLVKAAGMVSNICNDVVGDICGIVSGAMGAAIAARILASAKGISELLLGICISSLIAAMTVGGKSVGKTFGMRYSQQVVFFIGKGIAAFTGGKEPKKAK